MSNLIKLNAGTARIATDDRWQIVALPAAAQEVKKQGGKVVLFKLTGEASATPAMIWTPPARVLQCSGSPRKAHASVGTIRNASPMNG